MVSLLKFGATFKTTNPGRHKYSNEYIFNRYRSSKPVILDVGASDGSTALDLIQALQGGFRLYFVTDLNISVRCGEDSRDVVYFVDCQGKCILRASRRWLVYNAGERHLLFNVISRKLLTQCARAGNWREVLLAQPELLGLTQSDPRVTIMTYDMFSPWRGESPDLIKIANVLNPSYFSDARLTDAIRIQCANLASDGRLLIVDNLDNLETFSVFRKTPVGMRVEYVHDGGAYASAFVPCG